MTESGKVEVVDIKFGNKTYENVSVKHLKPTDEASHSHKRTSKELGVKKKKKKNEGWSDKYKKSIDCNNPKGFSQKAHCAGRKKKENVMSSKLEELVGKRLTEEQFDEAAGKKDACYHKVKARYDVWPSAYASGALVKCRKVGAKNWGNKSKKESVKEAMSPKVKRMMMNAINDEAAMDDFLKKYGKSIPKSQDRNIVRYRDDIRDAEMGYGDAEVSKKYLMKIFKKYIKESVNEKRGTCWVGYQQVGMKKKGGKMVPNCVKEVFDIYWE